MDDREFREWVDGEVERRLHLILSNEAAVRRYARNGADELDASARSVLEAIVTSEVLRESAGDPTQPATLDDESSWSVQDECVDPHVELPVLEVIGERYELLKEIGSGSQARTFLARARDGADYVAIKELSFDALETWKSLELFEREAVVLRSVEHPSIPAFVDTFQVDEPGEPPRFFLVQEFVSGESLDIALARGTRWSEEELRELALQMLSVFEHLHGLHPPIVHRDVKPSNIVRTIDGGYALVDFGAAQMVLPDETGGSTIIGTTGYMPPEQLSGRTRPASDLYALGATLAHLATGVHPREMRQERLRLCWRDRAALSEPFADVIDMLLEPVVEDRIDSAAVARQYLERLTSVSEPGPASLATVVDRPPHADARILHDGDSLVVEMSRSMIAPRVICASLGFVVGLFLVFMMGSWVYALAGLFVGLLISQFWSAGPAENLRVMPGARFRLIHVHHRSRRETSGSIERLAIYGSRLHMQTDAGRLIDVGAHCSPQTRRWIFTTVDAYLRQHSA